MFRILFLTAAALTAGAFAQGGAPSNEQAALDRIVDKIVARETELLEQLRQSSPLMETYIQEQAETDDGPRADQYYLGRARLEGEIAYEPFQEVAPPRKSKSRQVYFKPRGFAQMMVPDSQAFNAETYSFEFVRREFLGEVRCLLFEVSPRAKGAAGRFVGRIWVEDRDFHIVRLNGSYTPNRAKNRKGDVDLYFNFDSWRVNAGPGRWVPAYVYVEESGVALDAAQTNTKKKEASMVPLAKFKAQTRFWGYDGASNAKLSELTNILIETESAVRDESAAPQNSPLESQRLWERQAEENVLERLSKAGLLAPAGGVEKVLNTVVNNLIATNNLNVDVECRVLLTTPLETFSVGRAIVISRGLIDVLPDEASLAMVLAGELAHIALGHRTETQYAFSNRMMLSDAQVLERYRFARPENEAREAGDKAIEYLRHSPYKDKLANAGLFLKALSARGPKLPSLVQANLGNEFGGGQVQARLSELTKDAPELTENAVEQIAALPLGSRVKVDPRSSQTSLVKTRPVALLSAREKMPFEVTPFVIHLTRAAAPVAGSRQASR